MVTQFLDETGLQTAFGLLKTYIDTNDNKKQDKLTAGSGIEIGEDGTIKVTVDHTIYKVVSSLPASPTTGDENKIHLVALTTSGSNEKNQYAEYIWSGSSWEQLGTFDASADLADYVKDADLKKTLGDYVKKDEFETEAASYQKISGLTSTATASGSSTNGKLVINKGEGTTELASVEFTSDDYTVTTTTNGIKVAPKEYHTTAQSTAKLQKVAVNKAGVVTAVADVVASDIESMVNEIVIPLTDVKIQAAFNEVFE